MQEKNNRILGDFSVLLFHYFTLFCIENIMNQLFKIEIIVGTLIILCSLAFSLILRMTITGPSYFKNFYLYPLLVFILSLITVTNYCIITIPNIYINVFENFILIIENIFWGIFFLNFSNRKTRKYFKIIFIFSISIVLVITVINKFSNLNHKIAAITNLGFTLYCLKYFISLFKNEPIKKITDEPMFWIVTGLFFYSVFSVPLFPLCEYFKNQNSYTLSLAFLSVINLVVIIMHLFFIKGCLCLIRQHKAYLSLS